MEFSSGQDVGPVRPPAGGGAGTQQAAPGAEVTISGYAEVRAVLGDPRFVVPPLSPRDLPEGERDMEWLRRTVSRFSSGAPHERRRALVTADLRRLDPAALRTAARDRTIAVLRGEAGEHADGGPVRVDVMARLARAVPVSVLGGALGVAGRDLEALVRAVTAVAAAYHPAATRDQVARADAPVRELVALLGPGDPELVANRIGLLVQACDATAGLVGNTLAVVLRLPRALSHGWPVEALVAETLRLDPPVCSTRRVCAQAAELAGRTVTPGTRLVLDIAAANRDPRVFPDPHRFDPGHGQLPAPATAGEPAAGPPPPEARGHLTFGYGVRPCPGADHALALACGVVEVVLAGYELTDPDIDHEPSANLRVPARLEVRAR
ncbi:cytochrome P450 [Sphaerisporangium fuscum]|uniref:cytochrome P450 n=1 Tax=Sphaerisporangium fuscum TaxID=2835868 RepID=UPI001BDBB1CA|nr:cytochrome P450 [Sphaerisporangium fuscum]